ncbi:hypothetical protein MKK55_28630 [Methylobacterium sp. J-059]|uniref:hypothetical protein n=1 Tax=Methylobacterium sp. J-059 TaxID=2836643 RepID=UPI001FB8EC0C|nr:hypothetical protein [Methylobacterium sp. J-059]MCJ2042883.1 hypothetical protein [Methylobacterium sp. J-059]
MSMPVSEHPIFVTFNAPTWQVTLSGFDVGEVTDRAIAYVIPRLPARNMLKVTIRTKQAGAEDQIRAGIEAAIAAERSRRGHMVQ